MTAVVKRYIFIHKSDQAAFKFLGNISNKIGNNIRESDSKCKLTKILTEIFLEYLKSGSHLPKKFILFASMKVL